MKRLLFLLGALVANTISAQLLLNDDLSTLNTAQLSGQGNWTNNSSTYGGGACAGVACTNTQVVAASQNVANYGSSTKSLRTLSDQDAVGRNFTPMTTSLNGTNFYFSFLISANTVPTTTPVDFIRVMNGGAFNTAFRLALQNAAGGFKVGGSKNSGANTFSAAVLPLNFTHLIVVKYTYVAGEGNDVMSIYLNPPSSGEPATPQLTFSSGGDYSATGINFDRFYIRTNTPNVPTTNLTCFKAAATYADLFTTPLATSESIKSNLSIKVLENPAGNHLKISLPDSYNARNMNITIFDASGRKIFSEKYSENINISGLKKGVYTVEAFDGEHNSSFKLIKK